jgi:hypothetical protein
VPGEDIFILPLYFPLSSPVLAHQAPVGTIEVSVEEGSTKIDAGNEIHTSLFLIFS